MKAAVYRRYGPPEVLQLEDMDIPQPADDEVQIQIKASSVSSGDWHLRKADPFAARFFNGLFKPKLTILGSELAGVITATGANVKRFKVGDEVFGATGLSLGANAEYLCLSEDAPIAIKPGNISFREAAAIPFGAVTAKHFLQKQANLAPGQELLVYGASGAVGIYAVQLGKILGARVTAVCSGSNADLVTRAGADEVIDYTKEGFPAVNQHQEGQPWHVIMDTVGKTDFNQIKPCLTPQGQYLAIAGGLKEMRQAFINAIARLLKWQKKRLVMDIAIEQQADIEWFAELILQGRLKAVIDSEYSLENIAAAHHRAESGRKTGTLILTMPGT
ncbi:NAD(P)-dependent alcohol dehydrogenase [Bacterioplanoides sp.]|uniref:NAD(P)-dependent alcohol dehydrogenase n=1 Tax=Bacterioplanoides sp. TaxID=2066072 RepID=UPI003B5CAF32